MAHAPAPRLPRPRAPRPQPFRGRLRAAPGPRVRVTAVCGAEGAPPAAEGLGAAARGALRGRDERQRGPGGESAPARGRVAASPHVPALAPPAAGAGPVPRADRCPRARPECAAAAAPRPAVLGPVGPGPPRRLGGGIARPRSATRWTRPACRTARGTRVHGAEPDGVGSPSDVASAGG